MKKEMDVREILGVLQSIEIDLMWDINSKRFRERNIFGKNKSEFGLVYCF